MHLVVLTLPTGLLSAAFKPLNDRLLIYTKKYIYLIEFSDELNIACGLTLISFFIIVCF